MAEQLGGPHRLAPHLQGRRLQGRRLQGRRLQGRRLQGRRLQGRRLIVSSTHAACTSVQGMRTAQRQVRWKHLERHRPGEKRLGECGKPGQLLLQGRRRPKERSMSWHTHELVRSLRARARKRLKRSS